MIGIKGFYDTLQLYKLYFLIHIVFMEQISIK